MTRIAEFGFGIADLGLLFYRKINKDDKPKRVYYRNKFICVGPVRNYSPIQTPKKINKLNGFNSNLLNNITSETKLQKQVMNYKDFKNKNSSTNILSLSSQTKIC